MTGNQPPTLDPINNLTVNENAGLQTVNLYGITSGAANENQTLTVTAASGNINLIPNPAVQYTSPNTNGSLTFTPVTDATGSATITVTVNDGGAGNNIVTRTFTVAVNPAIEPRLGGWLLVAAQPTNETVKAGDTATFTVAASGTPPLNYQWSFEGGNLRGATNATLTLIHVHLGQTGSYAVLVTNNYGSVLSSNAVLTLGRAPIMVVQPASQSVLSGCDATFNPWVLGTRPLSYQWWKDGLAMSGQTNVSVTLTNVQTSDFGSYSVVVTNVFGSVTSSPAQLAPGHPPVAGPDTIYRFASGGVRVSANVLLANDTVAEWDSLTIIGVSPNSAAGGTVGLSNNWVFYAPPGGATNGDTFTYTVSDGHCGSDVGTVTVQIKADNPRPLNFAIANPGESSVRLTFDGIPGYNYRLEYTDSLSNPNWQTLGTQTADSLGVCQLADGSLTNAPVRFYRAVWP